MPFLQQGQTESVVVPAGQSIRIGAYRRAQASANIPFGSPGGPIAIVVDSGATFGPYPAGATIVVCAVIGEVEYVIGASPVLTDNPFNPAAAVITGGSVNNTPVGATTPNTGSFTSLRSTSLQSVLVDGTGTPGNVTQNTGRGRVALAAAASTIVVTNSQVAANSTIIATLRSVDGAATDIITVLPAAGSFTITMNGATTGTACTIDYLVVQN